MARTNQQDPLPLPANCYAANSSGPRPLPLVLLFLGMSMLSCTEPAKPTPRDAKTKSFVVSLQTTPAQIPVNQHFSMEFTVRAADGAKVPEQVAVNADMPSHGHGMNTKPRLTALGAGRWRVEGMLFHMPGAWEIYVYIGRKATMERAVFPVEL